MADASPIVLSEVTVTRDNGVDATVKLNASGAVHLLDFGDVTNSLVAISYRYKQTDASSWTTAQARLRPASTEAVISRLRMPRLTAISVPAASQRASLFWSSSHFQMN
jgi:hypothetical protein